MTRDGDIDRVMAAARKSARKFEAMTQAEKVEYQVTVWESIAAELNAAYLEQRSGIANYRLTEEDVLFARRLSIWFRFNLEKRAWLEVPENAAALDLKNRLQNNPNAILPDEVKRRLATKPVPPDAREVPLLLARLEDRPHDWPTAASQWSTWLEDLIRTRRENAQINRREPGEDAESTDAIQVHDR